MSHHLSLCISFKVHNHVYSIHFLVVHTELFVNIFLHPINDTNATAGTLDIICC
jgi:hypothetical protein